MNKYENNIENLIIRYLSNETNYDENVQLSDWIKQSAQNKSDFIAIKDIWDSSLIISDRADEQLAVFYKQQYLKSQENRSVLIKRIISVAAFLLLALVIGILVPRTSHKPIDNFQVFTVPLGSRSKVILGDGTEVNLNSGSELSYSNSFSNQNRSVTLTGEAFFNVKSDIKHPFIVKTKSFDIRVTGTRFNVCAYTGDNQSTTTLTEGNIELQIQNSNKVVNVNPGEKFSFDNTLHDYTLSVADIEQETGWKDGEFIFKKIMLIDLTKRLERWYDVKLTFSDDRLASFSYSGRFKNQETIWQILDALKLTSPIDYKRVSYREFQIIHRSIN